MLTDGEAFPVRLGAGCPPESVTTLPPEGDWLSKPNAGRVPSVCGLNWIWPRRWVAQPCGAALYAPKGPKRS